MTFASNASEAHSTLTAWWNSVKWSLRLRLRRWLGVGESSERIDELAKDVAKLRSQVQDVHQIYKDRFTTLDAGMERLNASDCSLEKLIASTAQDLQGQISEIISPDGPIAQTRPPAEEPVQMHAGHVRFSDRKRQYEAEHRRPISTEAGKQIAENARIIASGTRKEN